MVRAATLWAGGALAAGAQPPALLGPRPLQSHPRASPFSLGHTSSQWSSWQAPGRLARGGPGADLVPGSPCPWHFTDPRGPSPAPHSQFGCPNPKPCQPTRLGEQHGCSPGGPHQQQSSLSQPAAADLLPGAAPGPLASRGVAWQFDLC